MPINYSSYSDNNLLLTTPDKETIQTLTAPFLEAIYYTLKQTNTWEKTIYDTIETLRKYVSYEVDKQNPHKCLKSDVRWFSSPKTSEPLIKSNRIAPQVNSCVRMDQKFKEIPKKDKPSFEETCGKWPCQRPWCAEGQIIDTLQEQMTNSILFIFNHHIWPCESCSKKIIKYDIPFMLSVVFDEEMGKSTIIAILNPFAHEKKNKYGIGIPTLGDSLKNTSFCSDMSAKVS